jgi:hypothetical protein
MLRTHSSIYNRRHLTSAVDSVFKSDTKTPKICARLTYILTDAGLVIQIKGSE